MNVLREVFHGIEQKVTTRPLRICAVTVAAGVRALTLRGGGTNCVPGRTTIARLFRSSAFSINGRHFRIAGNDVARTIIGRNFDQYAAMLGHR